VARNTLAGGRRAGLETSLGTCTGLLVHSLAAAIGLSALLLASARGFTIVKLAGAGYLVFLGIRTLVGAGRDGGWLGGAPWGAAARVPAFRQGVLTNVLNPKIAVFFLSLLPQFVESGPGATARLLFLAAIFIGIGLVWLVGYTFALHAIGGVLSRSRVRAWVERTTGAVLVVLGLRLAVERG
jgi:threonine/homoserine/homoserine lactone efflux protein